MEFVKYQVIGNDYLVYDVIKNKEVLTREQIKKSVTGILELEQMEF